MVTGNLESAASTAEMAGRLGELSLYEMTVLQSLTAYAQNMGAIKVPDKGFGTFEELEAYMGSPGEGNAWHHIVEQSQIDKSGFAAEKIHNVNNIIALPHGKGSVHAKISGHYSSKQNFTNGLTVRQWLAGKSFEEQFEYGMKILKQYGNVIKTENGWIFVPFEG